MNQITIRRLDPLVVESLKRRAAEAGRSMEEEARKVLSDAVVESGIAQQRLALARLNETRKEIFGDRVFPDSSAEFRKMRRERTRAIERWALQRRRNPQS